MAAAGSEFGVSHSRGLPEPPEGGTPIPDCANAELEPSNGSSLRDLAEVTGQELFEESAQFPGLPGAGFEFGNRRPIRIQQRADNFPRRGGQTAGRQIGLEAELMEELEFKREDIARLRRLPG